MAQRKRLKALDRCSADEAIRRRAIAWECRTQPIRNRHRRARRAAVKRADGSASGHGCDTSEFPRALWTQIRIGTSGKPLGTPQERIDSSHYKEFNRQVVPNFSILPRFPTGRVRIRALLPRMVPFCSVRQRVSPLFQERPKTGQIGKLFILNGPMSAFYA